jgi:hypothetical protein
MKVINKTYEEALVEATNKAKRLFSENWKSIAFTETENYNEQMVRCYLHEDWGEEFHFEFLVDTKDYHMKHVFYHFEISK